MVIINQYLCLQNKDIKKDDIMMKVNTDIGNVFGWINQGNETTSNFKTYCQGGIKA